MSTRARRVVDPYYVTARTQTQNPTIPSLNRAPLTPRIALQWWAGVLTGSLRTPANTPVTGGGPPGGGPGGPPSFPGTGPDTGCGCG